MDDFGPVDSKRPRICRSEANYRSGTQPQSNGDYGYELFAMQVRQPRREPEVLASELSIGGDMLANMNI